MTPDENLQQNLARLTGLGEKLQQNVAQLTGLGEKMQQNVARLTGFLKAAVEARGTTLETAALMHVLVTAFQDLTAQVLEAAILAQKEAILAQKESIQMQREVLKLSGRAIATANWMARALGDLDELHRRHPSPAAVARVIAAPQ